MGISCYPAALRIDQKPCSRVRPSVILQRRILDVYSHFNRVTLCFCEICLRCLSRFGPRREHQTQQTRPEQNYRSICFHVFIHFSQIPCFNSKIRQVVNKLYDYSAFFETGSYGRFSFVGPAMHLILVSPKYVPLSKWK